MIDLDDVKLIQDAVFEVYISFDSICKKHDLKYYFIGGTVLGAVRHGGFIPWDDDMDITMPIIDYNRLIEILMEHNDFPFLINHYLFSNFSSGSYVLKLCNPKVKYGKINGSKTYIHDSFLSIFPLNNLPNSKFARMIYKKETQLRYLFLRFVRSAHNGVESNNHSQIEKIGIILNNVLGIGKKTSVRKATEMLDKCLQRYKGSKAEYVFWDCMGIAPFEWKRDTFRQPKLLKFESIQIPVMTEYDYYLQRCYGDYMELPSPEDRIPKHIDCVIRC